jgi:hypothetical protein
MAKHPEPGRVKTRLAARIGAERATRLYRAFIEDLRDRLAGVPAGIEVWWAFWPETAPFEAIVPGPRVFAQRGADLGGRLFDAMERVRHPTDAAVAAIGVDSPHLPLETLGACRAALDAGADVVLGPALDGGYYLIGTRAPRPALFASVDWGSATVFETTRARARADGLAVVELEPLRDVDDVDGLAALRAALETRPGSLPRTEAELNTWPV